MIVLLCLVCEEALYSTSINKAVTLVALKAIFVFVRTILLFFISFAINVVNKEMPLGVLLYLRI